MPATSTTNHAAIENAYDLGVFQTPLRGLWRNPRVLEKS